MCEEIIRQGRSPVWAHKAFVFSPTQYISIHRELFKGIYSHAGKIRDYNITKKEWVLDGDTVSYGHALDLREMLEYDFLQERNFRYNGLSMTDFLELFLQNLLLDGKNELHNREMHVSGMFMQKQYIDPIKQDIDPINDPINIVELSEREKKILELLRQDPTLTRAKMAGILGCSDATVKRALGSMVQKNVIRRIGSNKKGEWIMNR